VNLETTFKSHRGQVVSQLLFGAACKAWEIGQNLEGLDLCYERRNYI
jgi:hypothetical protein